ncbi:uncharacterized protein LOC144661556 [Oculina patagonica]
MDNEGGKKSGDEPKNPMTKEDAARIQSAEAKQHGGKVEKGGFAARAQSAADKRESKKTKKGGKKSSGKPKNLMTKEDAARIQSAEAKQLGGGVDKGSFASRAQAAADKREHENKDEQGRRFGEEPKSFMTYTEDAARFQSAGAKEHGDEVGKGSFDSRAQAAAEKRENKND